MSQILGWLLNRLEEELPEGAMQPVFDDIAAQLTPSLVLRFRAKSNAHSL